MNSKLFDYSDQNKFLVLILSVFPIALITGPLIPEIIIFFTITLFLINFKLSQLNMKEK